MPTDIPSTESSKQIEIPLSGEDDTTSEQDPAVAPSACHGEYYAPSPDKAPDQCSPHMPSFEGLLLSFDALEEGPNSNRPRTPQCASEMVQTSTPHRVDTGFGLREAQSYQSQRPSGTQPPGPDFPNHSQAGDVATSAEEASSPRRNGRAQDLPCNSPTPLIRSSLTKPSPKRRGFRVGYGRLLTGLLLINLSLSVLAVMCADGHFGQSGFLVAGIFPMVLVAVILSSIITRVINELQELRAQS